MAKSIVEAIIEAFPELQGKQLHEHGIWLQNDSDGKGDYIAIWDYAQSLPETLSSYKR
jgi:hypothetical protein